MGFAVGGRASLTTGDLIPESPGGFGSDALILAEAEELAGTADDGANRTRVTTRTMTLEYYRRGRN